MKRYVTIEKQTAVGENMSTLYRSAERPRCVRNIESAKKVKEKKKVLRVQQHGSKLATVGNIKK